MDAILRVDNLTKQYADFKLDHVSFSVPKGTIMGLIGENGALLSGGQRQRVLIARALCGNPNLLILDEPTASIDQKNQKEIYDLLQTLNKEKTIIMISHDISVLLGYAKKVLYVNQEAKEHELPQINNQIAKEHFCEVEMLMQSQYFKN